MADTEITVRIDDRTIRAVAGRSVAATLITAGITSWRTTRREARPRGLFCGIGGCFDCLVRIDDAPPARACLVPVRDGMIIHTDGPAPGTGEQS